MNQPRGYRQVARADATRALRERMLDAVDARFLPSADSRALVLADVARDAGTTVQTLLRHFGSKAGLLAAAAERGTDRVLQERRALPPGDVAAAATYLAQHYEQIGPWVLGLLAQADVPGVGDVTDRGRVMHRTWVEESLAPLLAPAGEQDRQRRTAVLVAVTDLLTWRVLRQEQGLSEADYAQALRETLDAVIAASWQPSGGTT